MPTSQTPYPSDDRFQDTTTNDSKYPDNHVYQTAGGVRFVVGNENGQESIKIFHPSGTYFETFPDGKQVHMTVGELKNYHKGGVTITVDENHDLHIRGHSKIQVAGGAHVEVSGDAGVAVGGSLAVLNLSGGLSVTTKGNLYLGADGNVTVNAGGSIDVQAAGSAYIGSGGGTTVQASSVSLNPGGGSSGYKGA